MLRSEPRKVKDNSLVPLNIGVIEKNWSIHETLRVDIDRILVHILTGWASYH